MSQNTLIKPVLVIGSSGQVASALKDIADKRFYFVGRPEFDIRNEDNIKQIFEGTLPALVINCSAHTAVDLAETEKAEADKVNGEAVRNLALQCKAHKIPLIHISTDYVFDGTLDRPYLESDKTNPLSVYGKSKLAGEDFIREILPEHIILRTTWVFSEYGNNFVKTMIKLAEIKDELSIVNDQRGSPTSADNIAEVIYKIARDILGSPKNVTYGAYNYTDSPTVSWYEFAGIIFEIIKTKYNKKTPAIKPVLSSEYKTAASRPLNSRLDCSLIEKNFGVKSKDWHYRLGQCIDKFIKDKT
jgi:dTDP-4-dehydrorhamnose reductase